MKIHLGKKSKEVLLQELFSLINRLNPNFLSKSEFEELEYDIRLTLKEINRATHLTMDDKDWIMLKIPQKFRSSWSDLK